MKSSASKLSRSKQTLPHGLATLLENGDRVPLPLRAIDVRFEVVGDCVQVCLQQEFELEAPNPVDVVYAFPLPSDAAVHQCVMTIGDRRVEARVKPAAEARVSYDEARRGGNRAALVEGLRDNLFELSLGNAQPGDAIRIDFSYALPLAGHGSTRELRIPVCPGSRYVPGKVVGGDGGTDLVPDAGRLARARIDAGHRDAAVFYCAGRLDGASGLESPSHEIEQVNSGGIVAVMLSGDVECPDRDFVLTWTMAAAATALMSPGDPVHVLCSLTGAGAPEKEPEGRDILFLLDSSGSMKWANWFGLLEAMELALGLLRPSDRFSIKLFDEMLRDRSDGWRTPDAATLNEVLDRLHANHPSGGTKFTEAFSAVVAEAAHRRRPVIVLVTDGQFGDEDRATRIARDGGVEVHTFGIDSNVNEGVLRKIARRTHGTSSLASPGQDLAEKVRYLMESLLAPSIHRIRPVGDWKLVGCPPSLRNGQSALVAFRQQGGTGIPQSIEVDLERSDGSTVRQSFPVTPMQGPAASVLASKFEVEALIDEGFDAEAVELACRRNILAPGASFVAVDEFESVVVARGSIEQANLVPGTPDVLSVRNGDVAGSKKVPDKAKPKAPKAGKNSSLPAKAKPSRKPAREVACSRRPSPKCAPPDVRRTLPDHQAELAALADRICCFEPVSWKRLFEETLLPWAASNSLFEDRLLKSMQDLARIRSGPSVRSCALAILSSLIQTPMWLGQRDPLEAFIEQHRALLKNLTP
jgi:Ca-activated chloride channel family protein